MQPVLAAEHPALVLARNYQKDADRYLTIEPYILSLYALSDIEHGRRFQEARGFITWYFSKLNENDRYGLSGTVYVHVLENGHEKSLGKYDSVDGYAGLFLYLLESYVSKTGDISLIQDNWNSIEKIASLIPQLMDRDGLTWAHPGHKAKYLMDNCEVYGGLSAYIKLRKRAGKPENPLYNLLQRAVRIGIMQELYTQDSRMFAWATVEEKVRSLSEWKNFYPDAYAQIFPIYYDVLSDQPEKGERIWAEFEAHYGAFAPKMAIEQRIMYELTKKKIEGL